ncbi:MAG: glutathione S-transferase family protein [Salaquimonas sp.]|jgi:glutathione S-transferase|nr:glutathione S-transferase family protein [Salaquimonas sp.]
MLKLYWAPQSRSVTSIWLLEEIGAPYERVLVDIRAGEQDTPEFRAINPMGKVPALTEGEAIVAEQGAICAWLGDRFPEAGLAPKIGDPLRATWLRWLFFAGNCIEPAYMQRFSGWDTVKARAAWGNPETVFAALEKGLENGPWICGERFTTADIMIGGGVFFGLAFGMLDKRPVFAEYAERCAARPAFRRSREIEAEAVASQQG